MLDNDDEERVFQEEIAPRIARAIDLSPLNQKQIAEMMGVTSQALGGSKKSGKISKPKLVKFAKATGTHLHWLMTGEGEPRNHIRPLYQVAERPSMSEQANKSLEYLQSLAMQGVLSDDDFVFLETMAQRLHVGRHFPGDHGRSKA